MNTTYIQVQVVRSVTQGRRARMLLHASVPQQTIRSEGRARASRVPPYTPRAGTLPSLRFGGVPACTHLRPTKCTLPSLHRKECKLVQRKCNHYNTVTFKYLESVFYVRVVRCAPCRTKLDMPLLN